MATSPVPQVAATSLDTAGVSLSTADPSLSDPRLGSVYDLTDVAAAAPLWFHPLHDGRYLMLNSRRWYEASPAGGNPGAYTAFSEDLLPTWVVMDGPSGRRSAVPGYSLTIPMTTAYDSRTLIAAATTSPDHLYLLNSVVSGGTTSTVAQALHFFPNGTVTIAAEETLPTATVVAGEVGFNKGLRLSDLWMYVYGTDPAGQVYVMRKPWAHLGVNKPRYTVQIYPRLGTPQGWEVFSGTGYSFDPAEIGPVLAKSGVLAMTGPLTTAGPMSFSSYRTTTVATTVEVVGDTYTGRFWTSASGRPWMDTDITVALGSGSGYLGGGIALQPQLGATPEAVGTATAGVPYLVSTKITHVDESVTLHNAWNIYQYGVG